jgi:hypothetical protein
MPLDMTGPHIVTKEPHYRRYLSQRAERIVVICVQDFDYHDYEPSRFVDLQAFPTHEEAEVTPLSAQDVADQMNELDPGDDLGRLQGLRLVRAMERELYR